jgi:hypothetical protein
MTIVGKNTGISEALNYHLSQLALSPTRNISWPNLSFTPSAGEIYLEPTFIPNRANYIGLNTSIRRISGLYQINVFGPTKVSPVPQDEIADLVVEHYLGARINRNNVLVRVGLSDGGGSGSGVPYASPAIIADGWRMVPVTVPWWCDA